MKLRLIAVVTLSLIGGGCAGLTPAVVVAGFSFGAQALRLDTAIFEWWAGEKPAKPDPGDGPG